MPEPVPILDLVVVVLFLIFVVMVAGMMAPITNLLKQSERTLDATENLIRTLDKELGPTLNEVTLVLGSVQEIKAIAEKRIVDVGTKVEDVTGSITKVADTAKTSSSVWGAGLLAGLKAYFDGKPAKPHGQHEVEKKVKASGS